jgi:hypothetical protein
VDCCRWALWWIAAWSEGIRQQDGCETVQWFNFPSDSRHEAVPQSVYELQRLYLFVALAMIVSEFMYLTVSETGICPFYEHSIW